ncbi:hypothetical protein DMC30DRAFT_392235 [Rhodotorula diobovata]|uniref:Uncharacterized protein n=1 Tax=Rhodotorula diobovata TaxID=5288 RepID=A0A5C5G0K8_9BASI|nr:hypothetical protein DMC30DRAFT_392235 [Rhodotorula diobovata]
MSRLCSTLSDRGCARALVRAACSLRLPCASPFLFPVTAALQHCPVSEQPSRKRTGCTDPLPPVPSPPAPGCCCGCRGGVDGDDGAGPRRSSRSRTRRGGGLGGARVLAAWVSASAGSVRSDRRPPRRPRCARNGLPKGASPLPCSTQQQARRSARLRGDCCEPAQQKRRTTECACAAKGWWRSRELNPGLHASTSCDDAKQALCH